MKAGKHRFHCHRDSYCHIFIIGQGNGQAEDGGTYGGMDWEVTLPRDDTYEVKVEYSHRDSNGPSRIEFWWQGNGEDYLPPYSWNDNDCNAQPYQWCGRYRLNKDSAGDSVPWRKFDGDGFLDKSWGGSPGYGISDDFAAAWRRKLNVPAGQYRFYIDHDDGVRFSVNNQLVLDQWANCCQTRQVDVWLNSGDNQLDVDWFDGSGSAMIKVRWEPLQLCSSLNVSSLPYAGGTVSISPAPNCDNATKYRTDTTVSLTANPAASSSFAGWGGDAIGTINTVNLLMNSSKTVNAYFDVCYSLTTSVLTAGAGSISTNPSPNCGSNKYRSGTNVNVLTVPNIGYGFINWSGAATGNSNPQLIAIDSNKSLTANYTQYTAVINTL
ncbi:MAG: hypothetical protein HC853_08565, partial [Anaerolineae bacterium]|nr:hypothetical protein [Anaerolineae bacterium]